MKIRRTQRHRRLRGERGQATLELALILPVLVLLLFGIVQIGLVLQDYLQLQQAVEQGARIGTLGVSDSQITQTIDNSAPSLNPQDITVTISPASSNRQAGTELTVQAAYAVSIDLPIISQLIGSQIQIASESIMRME